MLLSKYVISSLKKIHYSIAKERERKERGQWPGGAGPCLRRGWGDSHGAGRPPDGSDMIWFASA